MNEHLKELATKPVCQVTFDDVIDLQIASQRLIELNKIEEEFGMDLVTLHKILKEKIIYIPFIYDLNGNLLDVAPFKVIGINEDRIIYENAGGCLMTVRIIDYGKSYALTKEEFQYANKKKSKE